MFFGLWQLAVGAGISTPAFAASMAYYDSYRRARLPANLTQAQRDYFGAHTYERVDQAGAFHTEWITEAKVCTHLLCGTCGVFFFLRSSLFCLVVDDQDVKASRL